jgi:murein DD-endopeptidase MepM/ murein hydrolase activator NlpD
VVKNADRAIPMRRISLLIGLLLVVALTAPAVAEVTPSDLAEARDDLREVTSRLEGAAVEYEAAVQQEAALEAELDQLRVSLANQERELAAARQAGQAIAMEAYMSGGLSGITDILVADFSEVPAQLAYIGRVTDVDRSALNYLAVVERSYQQQQDQLDVALVEQEAVAIRLEQLNADISAELREADGEYRTLLAQWEQQEAERRRREEEERRRREQEEERQRLEAIAATSTTTTTVPGDTTEDTEVTEGEGEGETTTTTAPPPPPPAPVTAGLACPVNGAVAFTDTWGAPRSGGRGHKGVDMMAARGTPVVAVESGAIQRLTNSSLGGISIYLRGNSGDVYFYTHLDGWVDGLSGGQAVSAGQHIGFVGSTGNASYSAPHLHFEYHPGGGGAVNPTPLVRSVC